jgi:5-formyltetrahydrofolate cyclo-ligase
MQTKQNIRIESKKNIMSFWKQEKEFFSKNIINKLKKYINQYNTRWVYFPLSDEIDISLFIEMLRNHNKKIIIPQIKNNELIPATYGSFSEIKIWKYWIKEIISPIIYEWKIDIIIVPWLAFSYKNQRIGRGEWYYDKFLSKYPNSYKIWLCFPVQIYETLPIEEHDIPMNRILF